MGRLRFAPKPKSWPLVFDTDSCSPDRNAGYCCVQGVVIEEPVQVKTCDRDRKTAH